jgi:hypothetical protein
VAIGVGAMVAMAAGAQVVGGLVQAYNSEKARGANKKRLKDIEKMYQDIIPPDYDLTIMDPPELHGKRLDMPQFSGPEAGPRYNLDKLKPNQLKMVDKFYPQIAELVYEAEPTLIEKSPTMKMGLEAQKSALRKFMDIGEGGFDPVLQQKLQTAKDRAQAEAQSRSESIMQDFERRGLGGSGMELAAKIGAASQAMDRNAQMGLAAEAEAYQNQLRALSQGASLGGDIAAQDMRLQGTNADIINAFNQRMSKRHQDWQQARTDALNAADLRNIEEAQRIADYNTQTRNRYDQRHQDRMDDITARQYAARIAERNREDDLKWKKYAAEGEERKYADAANILRAKWRQGERDNRNRTLGRQYDDRIRRAGGISGASQAVGAANIGSAQDTNAAIQGLANIGSAWAMNQQGLDERRRDRDAIRDAGYYSAGGYGPRRKPYGYGG